ncbi:G8 domain-containing protein [uncultured Tateyamaria sp.]|uniref:G8 domain-containing protein n=1 Tax=uncultured Tateyamaria sp. TaxID=455651 RepID=UPI002620D65F|nr:G8 domain-containing protein [uncultured Tateyamaria sp.]
MEHQHGSIKNNNAFLMAMGKDSRIEIHADDASKKSFTRLGETAESGATSIRVAYATDWEVGDRIAIASSDFDDDQTEEFEIKSISNDGKTLTLDKPLEFSHFGDLETHDNGKIGAEKREWTVNERAEVALLSRNVKITGDDDSTEDGFGGHTMVHHGAKMHISGVEFDKMGQEGILGRYPVHWHLLGEGGEGQYVENSSIHHSYNRGITIHGTSNTRIEKNVVYDTIGHSYFFEDGAETGNLLRGNIGFGTRAAEKGKEVLESDISNVSTYWITNPNNHLINNIAAGSDNGAFWYAIGKAFTAESKGNPLFADLLPPDEAKYGVFEGNSAHSSNSGLAITKNPDQSKERIYITADNTLTVSDFQAHKMREWSANLDKNVGTVNFFDSIFQAAPEGLNFNSDVRVKDSLFFGESGNLGNPDTDAERAAGKSFADPSGELAGLKFYSGLFQVEAVHFAGFGDPKALGLHSDGGAGIENYFKGLTFDSDFDPADDIEFDIGNRRHGRAIYDEEGTISGHEGAFLTHSALAANKSAAGFKHPDFAAFVIKDAKLAQLFDNGVTGAVGPEQLKRFDSINDRVGNSIEDYSSGATGAASRTQIVFLGDGNDYLYSYDYGDLSLEKQDITFVGANSNEYIFVEILNATQKHFVPGALHVDSVSKLKSAQEKAYYYENGSLFVKVFGGEEKDPKSQIDIDLGSSSQPFDTVPYVPYEPLKYTKQQIQDMLSIPPHPEKPTKTAIKENLPTEADSTSEGIAIKAADARWSDAKTWGGRDPEAADVIVIGPGQRVVLDESTTVKGIIVNGGELVVEDKKDLALSADWILVNGGGTFQVGTEDTPFEHEFDLTLEGDDKSLDIDVGAILKNNSPKVLRASDAADTSEPMAGGPANGGTSAPPHVGKVMGVSASYKEKPAQQKDTDGTDPVFVDEQADEITFLSRDGADIDADALRDGGTIDGAARDHDAEIGAAIISTDRYTENGHIESHALVGDTPGVSPDGRSMDGGSQIHALDVDDTHSRLPEHHDVMFGVL